VIEVPANTVPVHVQPWAIPHEPAPPPVQQLAPGEGVLARIARIVLRFMGSPKEAPHDHGVV
jgi:hypothetical protein